MSLAAQFMQDVEQVDAEGAAGAGKLPLFAAADEIAKKQRNHRIAAALLLLSLPVGAAAAWYQGLLPGQSRLTLLASGNSESPAAIAVIRSEETVLPVQPIAEVSRVNEPVVPVAPVELLESDAKPITTPEKKPETVPDLAAITANMPETMAANTPVEAVQATGDVDESLSANLPVSVKKNRIQSPEARDQALAAQANRLLATGNIGAASDLLAENIWPGAGPKTGTDFKKSAAIYIALLIDRQQYPQAENLLLQYRDQQPYALEFFKLDVRLSMAQQHYTSAIAKLDQLPVPVEKDPAFLEFRAVALQAQGQYQDASAAYRHLLQYDSRHSRWWMGLAIALDAGAHREEAKQAYLRALSTDDLRDDLSRYAYQRIAQL